MKTMNPTSIINLTRLFFAFAPEMVGANPVYLNIHIRVSSDTY